MLVYLLFLLHFALFSYHFICFFASNYPQISWFTDLLDGVLSYPPGSKKGVSSLRSFFDRASTPTATLVETPPFSFMAQILEPCSIMGKRDHTRRRNIQSIS